MGIGMGLASAGIFAGGATEGFRRQQEENRRMQEERRRQEEYTYQKGKREREEGFNTEAGAALANNDYAGVAAAGVKYKQSPTTVLGVQNAGLQYKGAQRASRITDDLDNLHNTMREFQAGQIDESEAIRRATAIHGKVPDGEQGFITSVNGSPHVVIADEATRTSQLKPITGDGTTFMRLYDQLRSAISPEQHDAVLNQGMQRRRLDLQGKEVGIREAAQRDTAAFHTGMIGHYNRMEGIEQEYKGRGGVLDRYHQGALQIQGRNADRLANAVNKPHWMVLGTDKDGQPISFDQTSNTYKRPDGQPIQDWNFFNRTTGAKPGKPGQAGLRALPGNPGVFADDAGNMWQLDDRSHSLVPVMNPGSIKELGQGMVDRLQGQGGTGGGGGLRPPVGGTSGSHPVMDQSPQRGVSILQQQIADIDDRLRTRLGTNPEIQLQWQMERDALVAERDRLLGGVGYRAPGLGNSFRGNR